MKLSRLAWILSIALITPLMSVSVASASTVQIPNSDDPTNAVGLIVTYRPGIDLVAPNGQATGENYSGVSLEDPVPMGANMASVAFSESLNSSEANEALNRIRQDPRVQSAQFNRFFENSFAKKTPFAQQVLPSGEPVTLPVIFKTAFKRASIPPLIATDAWISGTTARVKVSWAKPTTSYSGTLVGFKVQLKVNGTWITRVSQTKATTRSYTTASMYFKPGTPSEFRVAALTRRSGVTYVGFYKTVSVIPTTAPKQLDALQLRNLLTKLQVSWTSYESLIDRGGLPVSYSISVKRPDDSIVACVMVAGNVCDVSGIVTGTNYSVTLTVTNSKGSSNLTKNILFNVAAAATPSSNSDYSKQWFLKSSESYSAKVSDAWSTETGLENVVVAILDTGYTDHTDLPASRILPGYDMISNASSANDGNGRDSDAHDAGDFVLNGNGTLQESSSWHGTHVAGIVGAADNNAGVIGIAPNVRLLPVRVLGVDGGTTADIISGIYWAAGIHRDGVPDNPNKANVVNLSIGGYSGGCDSETENALAAAKSAGVTVVTAAGNDNPASGSLAYASLSYPGNCYPTINVGSSGKNGRPAFYSNFSNAANQFSDTPYGVDISAPGGDYCQGGSSAQIFSTLNSGTKEPGSETYSYEIGTSMAAPVVSGTVALMYSAKQRQNPGITFNASFVNSIWNALSTTSTPFFSNSPVNCASTQLASIQDGGAYGGYGVGIVNASAALERILE